MKVTVIDRKGTEAPDNDFLTPDFDMIALAYCRFGMDRVRAGNRMRKGAR